MTETDSTKPVKVLTRWIVGLTAAVAVLVLLFLLQACGVLKPKAQIAFVPTPVIVHWPPQGPGQVQLEDAGPPTGGEVHYVIPLDTTPNLSFDWRYAIRWLDFAPGEGYLNRRDTFGRKWLAVISVPADLNYEVEVETDSVTGEVRTEFRKIPQPVPVTKRTMLSVFFAGGFGYQEIDTTWGFRPRFEAGIDFSPWDWLSLQAPVLAYPPSVGAEIEIDVPIVRK